MVSKEPAVIPSKRCASRALAANCCWNVRSSASASLLDVRRRLALSCVVLAAVAAVSHVGSTSNTATEAARAMVNDKRSSRRGAEAAWRSFCLEDVEESEAEDTSSTVLRLL